jgi:hypothetical protein
VVIVEGSIASLNVARTFALIGTPVAAFAGAVNVTTGGVVSGVEPVVKPHTKLAASARPEESVAPVVIVAVCAVLGPRLLVGSKLAVRPTYVTTPDTGVAPCLSVNVDVVIVEGSIASLNVARTFALIGVPVVAFAGDVKATTGGVASTIGPGIVTVFVASVTAAIRANALPSNAAPVVKEMD